MKRHWRSMPAVAGGLLTLSASARPALAQEQAGEAARGAAGAITGAGGGGGDLGIVIVVGVALYGGIFIISGLFKLFAGVLHRDRREISQGVEGVTGGIGCLLVGAIVIGAVVLVSHLLSGHGR